MYSAFVTAALFIGIIINDYISNQSATNHIFIGIIAVAGMVLLAYKGLDRIGWILLAVPVVVISVSFIYISLNSKKEAPTPVPAPAPAPTPAPKPSSTPILNLPDPLDDNSVCIEYSAPPKIKTAPQCTLLADGTVGLPPACPTSEPASVHTPPPPTPTSSRTGSSNTNSNPTTVSNLLNSIKSNLTPVSYCNSPSGNCP